MSDFSSLKRQRAARNTKSFAAPVPSANVVAESAKMLMEVDTKEVRPASQNPNEAGSLPQPQGGSANVVLEFAKMEVDTNEVRPASQNPNEVGSLPLPQGGLYRTIPPGLDVRRTTETGRGVYSKYSRRPGDVLLAVKPHVATLSSTKLADYCSCCFAQKNAVFQRCTSCKVVYYCDTKCQGRDWTFHRNECTAIQRWSTASQSAESGTPVIPADAIRCLARMVWRKQKLGSNNTWTQEIDALQSHRTSLSKDPNSQESQMYAQLAHALVNYLGISSPQDMSAYGMQSAADLVDLISKLSTNTFTVSTSSLEPLGACVSPSIALINHSCEPNAVVVFPRVAQKEMEPLMQVIALKHISPDEEILTSYIDTTLPRDKRREILKQTYHFICKCALCSPSPDGPIDMRETIWCPKKCGGVCPMPTEENSLTRCKRCQVPVKDTDAVLDAVRVGQEALDKAEALQVSDPDKSLQLTTKLIPILVSAGLVPGSHPLLALSRLNASLLINHLPSVPDRDVEEVLSPGLQHDQDHTPVSRTYAQEQLDDAIRAATRVSTGLSQILAEGHPVRGVALAELGKLLSVDEPDPAHAHPPPGIGHGLPSAPPYPPSGPPRLKLAYETLLRARSELLIGFGGGKNEGGEVGRVVRDMAADLEKEIQVWKEGVQGALQDRRAAGKK